MRTVNKAGLDLIKSFEGSHLKPYLCPANVATIGWGTTVYPNGKKVTLKDPAITEEQATEYLMHDIKEKAQGVERAVKVPINDNEFSALVSFVYNVGIGALQRSTLLKLLNANADRTAVADQLLRWNKAAGKVLNGLTRRREAERSLFLQPVAEEPKKGHLPDIPTEEYINKKLKELEDDIMKK
jgi:lysozyme